ncbi:MAG: FtsK/SpoIIIE domain-containing protein, partial [bacterium]|nr:FtsK/SpoIIIE domain-containing protein [bacterium]
VRASRQIGWVLVILGVTTIAALLEFRTPLAPVVGAGGYLGAMTSTWLNEHFALFGSLILTLTIFVAGLLLSTDYIFVRGFAWLLVGGTNVARSAAAATKNRVQTSTPGKKSPRRRMSDVENGVELNEDAKSGQVPIRIRGQHLTTPPENPKSEADSGLGSWLRSVTERLASLTTTKASSSVADPIEIEDLPEEEWDESDYDESLADDDYLESNEEEEFDELDSGSESRELEVANEIIQVRSDQPHTAEAEEPLKITTPQSRKKATAASSKAAAADSLAHLDDTKLPAGTEEYVLPGIDLLLESDDIDFETQATEVRRKARILEKTFNDFGFNVRVVEIETGPVIAQYEVELEAGLRLSKITGLADDLAIALRVPSVRIVAPIPGKNTVGIEVPNETRQVVRLREVIEEQSSKSKKFKIPLFLGKDVSGNPLTADLATLPHLLIAGRTGTGKSVCLNAIIASILMTKRPDEVRMLMIDPKMVELSGYGRLPHLMHPVVTDMRKAEAILAWAVDKMEERYALLARAGVRHITSYNELGREELLDRLKPESDEETEQIPDHLPFIVIVADEMADLMMTAGKEVEQHIIRLAQKSRAVGIHLILATQKPTVDVITGLIKSNLPARISFQVASRTDSRVVLDEMGADKLLGNGDMLFLWPGTSMLLRGQGTYMSDEEINSVVDHCSTGEQNFVN